MRKAKTSERGFTLIELCVGIAVLFVVMMVGMQLLFVMFSMPETAERARRAQDAGDSAMESLTARLNSMGIPAVSGGGTFTVAADNRITITGTCSFSWCDKFVMDAGGNQVQAGTSMAGGTGWSVGQPAGSTREFVRRWRISTVPTRPDLRELTVAVLDSDTSTEPLSVLTTRVPLR
jgi:type II secretory pathway pseudopilin PulG